MVLPNPSENPLIAGRRRPLPVASRVAPWEKLSEEFTLVGIPDTLFDISEMQTHVSLYFIFKIACNSILFYVYVCFVDLVLEV